MKLFINLFVSVFFILAVVKTADSQNFTVTGKVRYSDNHEVVTSGKVKLYLTNGEIESVAEIQENGDYILGVVRVVHGDLIGFPNIGNEFDFIPTGYPDRVNPNEFTHITVDCNLTGIDIYVQRPGSYSMPFVNIATVSGIVLNNNNEPVKDAVVYVKTGTTYMGHGVTNSKGEYVIKNVPAGDYILIAHKVGSESDSKNITLTEKGLNNVSLSLTSKNTASNLNNAVSFQLSQNYPNPFNPSTIISYALPSQGNVALRVYNTVGQVVAELVNTYQNAGAYNVEFNAKNLSSGIYYYRLETNGFTDTKKMILVK